MCIYCLSTKYLNCIHRLTICYNLKCEHQNSWWFVHELRHLTVFSLVFYFISVQSLSCVQPFAILWTAARQASLSITNSWGSLKLMSSSGSCHPTISSSVVPFSSCLQSFPASGSFQVSQFFTSGGQRIRVPGSASDLSKNIQDWSPLRLTGWISLQSKGLARVFSNTTVQKHQFFGAQLTLQSNSHIHAWLLEKP